MTVNTKHNPDKHHRRTIRLCGYDYSCDGLYFITVCSQGRACLFGEIVDGEMILNPAGRMVEKCWLAIPNRYRNVILHEYVVMPNRTATLRNTSLRTLPVGRTIIFITHQYLKERTGMGKDKILVAGATGYLGKYITRELLSEGFKTKIIVRNPNKIEFGDDNLIIEKAEVTRPETLKDICKDVRVVISTVGITRQKDGLTYMDVDYGANANLIDEAKKSGVEKFIYVSVLNGEKLRHLKICEAKEKLGDYLKSSGLDYCIVRPSGFFSDMGDFLKMAEGGRVYLFGDGKFKINPIHGEDLAKAVVETIHNGKTEIDIGGCRVFSHNDIAELALNAYSKPVKIVHLPDWIRKFILWFLRTFTNPKFYGPLEFFMTAMAMDMQATPYGKHKLEDYFKNQVNNARKPPRSENECMNK